MLSFLVILTAVKHPNQWEVIKLCDTKGFNQGVAEANALNFLSAFLHRS